MRAQMLLWLVPLGLATAGACSLDLDESLIDANEADASAGSGQGGTSLTGGTGGSGGAAGATGGSGAASGGMGGASASGGSGAGGSGGNPVGGTGGTTGGSGGSGGTPGGSCTTADDCTTTGECLSAQCIAGQCVFEVCPPTSTEQCNSRQCSEQTNSCSASTGFGFNAEQLQVGDEIGCSGNAERCLAAVGSMLFVGTANTGLKAWDMNDPTNPREITVEQPPLVITRLVETQGRLLVVGSLQSQKLQLAWIDVPADPQVETLATTTVLTNFAESFNLTYPADPGAVFLVNTGQFFPAVRLEPPYMNNDTITLSNSAGIPAGHTVVASSATRLVTFEIDSSSGTQQPFFSLETQAGTPGAQNSTEASVFAQTGEVPVSLSAHKFASTRTGALLWSTNRIFRTDGGPPQSDAVVFRWPLIDGNDDSFNGLRSVVLESYSAGSANAVLAGPSALVGESKALVTATEPSNPSQTAVRSVERVDDTLTLGSSRFVISFSPNQIGVAGGVRYGYILTPSTTSAPSPPNTTLWVFAPDC